jgi:lipopolysaccharide assembly protein A
MSFLKRLLWVVIAGFAIGLAAHNWRDVTLSLWGDLQIDIKLPVLLLAMVLLGWLPAWLGYRARMWRARRAALAPAPVVPVADGSEGPAA